MRAQGFRELREPEAKKQVEGLVPGCPGRGEGTQTSEPCLWVTLETVP